MTVAFSNFASTQLSGSITNVATSMSVLTTQGDNFPATVGGAWFYVTLVDSLITPTLREIVKVTSRAGDNFNVCVRGQDGTTPIAWNAGAYVQLRVTKGTFADLMTQTLQVANNLSDITVPATARTALGLGTMATQNATAVAVSGGTIAGATITGSTIDDCEIGQSVPSQGAFTTIVASDQFTSTVATGTTPMSIASTTVVGNLNVSALLGFTWNSPGAIGSVTPSSGAFTTLSASGAVSGVGFSNYLASPPAIGGSTPAAGTFTAIIGTTIRATTYINYRGGDNASSTNSGFGETALDSNAGGTNNTACGYAALTSNTTGSNNSAFGYFALTLLKTGSGNIGFGASSLASIQNGNNNIAIGLSAGSAIGAAVTAGNFVIGVTYTIITSGSTVWTSIGAADNNPGTIFVCTGIGSGTGTAASSTSNNIAIGANALTVNTTGSQNISIGHNSLIRNLSANDNIALGQDVMQYVTTGKRNVAIGTSALLQIGIAATAGSFVVGVSYTITVTGTTNFTLIGAANSNVGTVFTATGVGVGTGEATPNSDNNTAVGYLAGASVLTTGTTNTLIGASAEVTSSNQTNSTAIGYQATATADNQVILGNSSVTTTVLRGQVTAPAIGTSLSRKTANYTVLATDTTILCDTSGGGFTITLEASPANGHLINVKKITTDANTLTIGRNGKSIEGAAADVTTALTTRPNYQLQYESANNTWWVL
jgi:hypothetical protein